MYLSLIIILLVYLFPYSNIYPWIDSDSIFTAVLSFVSAAAYIAMYLLNLPQVLSEHKFTKSISASIAFLVITTATTAALILYTPLPSNNSHTIEILLNPSMWEDNNFFHRVITTPRTVLSCIFIGTSSFIALTVRIVQKLIRQTKERKLLEQNMRRIQEEAELALYKAQINPHFLFNTLNSIYALVISKSDAAEEAFIKFTNITKYIYNNAEKESISIGDELDYILQYIDLQTMRTNEQTKVNISHSIDNTDTPIAPMLLITFIENAFKYGVTSSHNSTINIVLTEKNKQITFSISNTINYTKTNITTSGIGIQNCRKRLSLLYPNRHTLDITSDNNTFYVNLTLS